MKIEQLEVVLEVLSAGSISAAAKNLETNQPSVSRIVKSVEEELGTSLFERASDGVLLSEAGEKILPFIIQVVQDYAALLKEVRNVSVELCSDVLNDTTELNIAISPVVLDSIISPILASINQSFPISKPRIHVLDGLNPNELHKLPAFDLYIGHNIAGALSDELKRIRKKGMYSIEMLYKEFFCLIVSKHHPLAELGVISKEVAREYPMILHDNGFSSTEFYQRYYHTDREIMVLFKSNNPRTIKEALHKTEAVFFTTEFFARRDYMDDEKLKIIKVCDTEIDYFCMYPKVKLSTCLANDIILALKSNRISVTQ